LAALWQWSWPNNPRPLLVLDDLIILPPRTLCSWRIWSSGRARRYSPPRRSCLTVRSFLRRPSTVVTVPRDLLLLVDSFICRTNGPSFIGFLAKAEIIASSVGT